jgi:hypothetical protein
MSNDCEGIVIRLLLEMGHGAEPCLSSIRFQIRLPHVPSTATQECGCRFNPEGMDDLCRHCPRHRARKNGTSRMGLVRPRKCLRPAASGAKRPFTGMSAFEGRTDLPFKYSHLTRSGHEQPDAFRGLSYTLQWWRLALCHPSLPLSASRAHVHRERSLQDAGQLPSLSPVSTLAFVDGRAEGAGKGAGFGAGIGGAAGLMADLRLLAIPGLGPAGAAGWLAATAVGAAAGAQRAASSVP